MFLKRSFFEILKTQFFCLDFCFFLLSNEWAKCFQFFFFVKIKFNFLLCFSPTRSIYTFPFKNDWRSLYWAKPYSITRATALERYSRKVSTDKDQLTKKCSSSFRINQQGFAIKILLVTIEVLETIEGDNIDGERTLRAYWNHVLSTSHYCYQLFSLSTGLCFGSFFAE